MEFISGLSEKYCAFQYLSPCFWPCLKKRRINPTVNELPMMNYSELLYVEFFRALAHCTQNPFQV